MKITTTLTFTLAATLCGLSAASAQDTAIGTASVDRWPDGKKTAFMMMFDDGCPSHVNNAIPELAKRNLTDAFSGRQGFRVQGEGFEEIDSVEYIDSFVSFEKTGSHSRPFFLNPSPEP